MNVYLKVKNNKIIIINNYQQKEKVIKVVVVDLIDLKKFYFFNI